MIIRRLAALTLAGVLLLASAPAAQADLSSDLQAVQDRIDRLQSEIGSVEDARSEIAAAVLEIAAELEAVVAELRRAETLLADTEVDIAVTEAHIAELTDRIGVREARVDDLRARAADTRDAALERLVELYMTAGPGSTITLEVSTDDPGVGIVYAERVQGVANEVLASFTALRVQEQREVARIGEERTELEGVASALDEQRRMRAAEAEEVAAATARVEERLAEQEALLAEMDRQIAEIEGEITALAAEEDSIKELIRQEQSGGGSSPGILLRPVPGAVTSGFGYRTHPIYGDQRLHTGWDMNGACGSPIVAAGSGRVFLAGWNGGYGNAIMVDHGGGMATLYAHQSSFAVGYGTQVSAGQVIGYVGTTGVSTGCHLHFEVRISGTPVDPTPYL
jgi:murein DD-endopeptidase MepM/ murein hydrolase activator NlpD